MSEIAVPFHELPEQQQSELLAWVKAERERKFREDPVIFVQLQYPDGTNADNEIHEMHRSLAVQMNDERLPLYMLSQRARAAKLAAWEKAVADAEADRSFNALKKQAQAASSAKIIPLSDSKQSNELLAYRRANVPEVTPPAPRTIPRPDVSWNDHDALWIQIQHSGTGVIRHD